MTTEHPHGLSFIEWRIKPDDTWTDTFNLRARRSGGATEITALTEDELIGLGLTLIDHFGPSEFGRRIVAFVDQEPGSEEGP